MNKITPLIVIVAVCLIALLFLRGSDKTTNRPEQTLTAETTAHWKLLDEPSIEYQALFPAPPRSAVNNTVDSKTQQLRTYKLYAAEALDASLFLITEIQFPKDYNPTEDPTILDTIVSDLVANGPTNSLKSTEATQFNGDQALKFTIDNENKMEIMGLAFIHGQSIFILTRASTIDKANQKEFDFFVKSFKFKSLNKENPLEGKKE